MQTDTFTEALTGTYLLAMPSLQERAFRKGVILICAHSDAGAIGLMINRPATNMTLRRLLREAGETAPLVSAGVPIHAGGPADFQRTFVLHRPDYHLLSHTVAVGSDVSMTPHITVAQDIGAGRGPNPALVALGYCGWGAGQLEQEIADGSWLTTVSDARLIFEVPCEDRWSAAMRALGVTPSGLSHASGHA